MKNISLILGFIAIAATSSNVSAMNGYEGTIYAGAIFVGASEYANDKALHSISIPASVEQIGESSFQNSGLNRITFAANSSLQRIHNNAFSECKQLKEIVIPESIQSIGNKAFLDAGLTKLTIEGNNSNSCTIASMAFAGNPIRDISILKSISKIGKEAFQECEFGIIKISGLYFVGNASFAINKKLKSVIFNDCNNITINQDAFFDCNNLTNFTISGTIGSIHPNAFGYFGPGQYASITNFTIFGAEDARIRNQLIAAGIRPEAIHFNNI